MRRLSFPHCYGRLRGLNGRTPGENTVVVASSSYAHRIPAAEFQLLSLAKPLLKLGKNIVIKLYLDKLDSHGACVASELESGFQISQNFILLLFN